ncbi:hypothetical protein BT63DRAFT_97647 [Microthyrium microscopicum]|uniref:Uncharacterized protein n=1 Tax=Microthyrium microscopicum TaxID=703497 RepID=A0A6A6U0I7_9PEZI|nr:hypothetical protein BT63DRAFT_97647 [Microthyrium microscopicum]
MFSDFLRKARRGCCDGYPDSWDDLQYLSTTRIPIHPSYHALLTSPSPYRVPLLTISKDARRHRQLQAPRLRHPRSTHQTNRQKSQSQKTHRSKEDSWRRTWPPSRKHQQEDNCCCQAKSNQGCKEEGCAKSTQSRWCRQGKRTTEEGQWCGQEVNDFC